MRSLADSVLLTLSDVGVPAEKVLRALAALTRSYLEMIEGQYLDLEYEKRLDITVQDYIRMVSLKTGALIQCSLELGALIASDDEGMVRAFARCGRLLGLAFQSRDDILGIWGDKAATGKATGNDIRRKKKTLPVVYALEHAPEEKGRILREIYTKEALEETDVERVLAILEELGADRYAQGLAREKGALALEALEGVPIPSGAMEEMREVVEFLVERSY